MAKELKKILFADDDADIHLILKICLQEIPGLEVRSALSGEEVIKVALEFQPDMILLDVMMPKMDGIEALQALKLMPSLTDTLAVFVTAKAQKNEVESYFKYGVVDVITKPFNPLTFASRILKIWEQHPNHPS